MITVSDSLIYIKSHKDYEFNIIYADPPYALGSEIYIRPDGKVDYRKAADFMNKWKMPTGEYWEQWFKEAFRTLKHGGYLILFGIDRQTLLFKYYAALAGFTEKQSLYWYFISNFPKATDLSKMLDKQAGAEREIGEFKYRNGATAGGERIQQLKGGVEYYESLPTTDLAKKYDGYKYSIAPLKQTNETIMVFMKPTKTGSPLHDTLAYESGDDSINVSALDIDGNRVGTEKITQFQKDMSAYHGNKLGHSDLDVEMTISTETNGRYPSQTFIDNETAQVIDEQSGVSGGNYRPPTNRVRNNGIGLGTDELRDGTSEAPDDYGDIGGASKILHKCKFEQDDLTLYYYEPKVGNGERNAGTEKNNHPTLKPIDLNYRILKLFKTPNPQTILYPFAGSGSEIIGGIKAGFDNWLGCEINPEYVEIANARIEYWRKNMYEQQSMFDFIGDNNG